jgi:hypothetical protein
LELKRPNYGRNRKLWLGKITLKNSKKFIHPTHWQWIKLDGLLAPTRALHSSELLLRHASTEPETINLLVLETCSCTSTKNIQKLHRSKLCLGKSKQGKSWTLPRDARSNLGKIKKNAQRQKEMNALILASDRRCTGADLLAN